MGGGLLETSRRGKESMESHGRSSGSDLKSSTTSYLYAKRDGSDDDTEEEWVKCKVAQQFPAANLRMPTGTGTAHWVKYFAKLEEPLREWYNQRNSPDATRLTTANWNLILPYAERLMAVGFKLFINDVPKYLKNELDIRVWKYGIYLFIHVLRGRVPSDEKQKKAVRLVYEDVLSRGINHFKGILMQSTKVLGINLGPILFRRGFIRGSLREAELTSEENLVYRLLIALGDLYRYAFEVMKRPSDLKMAVDMYNAARLVDTDKCRAYNQLAVLSKSQNYLIETIYYYTRAWAGSITAEGSRDQLLYLYDDIYKKYAATKAGFWSSVSKTVEAELKVPRLNRKELWLSPFRQDKTLPPAFKCSLNKQHHIESLTECEVLARFSLAYAHLMGILYTKIGTENLEEVAKNAMIYFEGLVFQKKSIKFAHLMKVIGMLLFMADHLNRCMPGQSPGTVSQLDFMRDIAMRVTIEMVGYMSECIIKIFKLLDWDNPTLTTYLAAVHVWIRWAKGRAYVFSEHLKYWRMTSPRNIAEKTKLLLNENTAASFRRLVNEIRLLSNYSKYIFPSISFGATENCDTRIPTLPEQLLLDRFGTILLPRDYDMSSYFSNGRHGPERAQNQLRLSRIVKFGKRLFGDPKVPPKSPREDSDDLLSEPEDKSIADQNVLSLIQRFLKPTPKNFKVGKPDCNNARVIVRKSSNEKNQCLLPKHSTTKVYELWSNLCAMGVRTDMLIQPLRVVLDTNCFIRNLEWVECLLKVYPGTLYLPTTVISELRGLGKGLKPSRSRCKPLSLQQNKTRMIDSLVVAGQCSSALAFMKDQLHRFTVVTTKGKTLKMYNIMKQKIFDSMLDGVNNDEKILETCRQLEAQDEVTRRKDTPFRIYRNTVLLTADRSLRLRAYASDIPAREVHNFTLWLIQTPNGKLK
ncbi:Telomerase-binding protein hypothetical proteinA [Orchesella cincta]|uniref:PIN domain-containing protein n=1 Tax=Orchesella cincta TaxID=48709 RepID=A0A1D2NC98_ORCCI|nr:Telomerase-binding protein hypothetical proteinA [Orchesella cincta]